MRRVLVVIAVALTVPGAATARVDAGRADPGVTSKTIFLGGTVPLSGIAAAFGALAPGANAYFKYVNSKGGVHGRKIVYRYYDDGYEPARTVQLTRQLVERDKVFAIFSSAGTANGLAVRPYLNQLKVPQLFQGDGSSELAKGHRRYPWSMGYLPSYIGEGAIYGRNIARTRPNARIAVLYENSSYGNDLLAGLKRGLAGKGRIVATQSHSPVDTDVKSQVASLKSAGANTFMVFTTPTFMIQSVIEASKLGWRPQLYISAISIEPTVMRIVQLSAGRRAVENAISMVFLKDPTNPRWARDPAVLLYKRLMKRYAPGRKASDVYHYYGMTAAHSMVTALRNAGRNPTRAKLLRAATHLRERNNPFLIPGIVVQTSPTNYHPISKAQLYRYRRGRWQPFSGLLGARG